MPVSSDEKWSKNVIYSSLLIMKQPKHLTVEVNIPVIFMREGKKVVAFSPALDVATSADTFAKAQRRFDESVEIFFEELAALGTLEEVLLELGWEKANHQWEPPTIISHASEAVRIPVPT